MRASSRFEYLQNSSSNNKIRPSAFSFQAKGEKKKLAKRNAKKKFRCLRTSRRAPRPPPRKLLKKLDQNFLSL